MEDLHWADRFAQEVIDNNPNKKKYMVESGITPSGIVHIGNFREVMVQELVYRALLDKGVNATFQYVWDDFDRFRKVPKGVDEKWEQYIGMPVTKVPDPWGCHDSYAAHFKEMMESELENIGVRPNYISATELYEKCTFAENLKTAFEKTKKIQEILNQFRREPLAEDWVPAVAYCEKCGKDFTKVTYIGDYNIKYECKCGHSNKIDFSKIGIVKFKWRIDWPSRWNYFDVDFESSGKDHKARGGSWDTGEIISKEIFGGKVPLGPMYEFINM
ncbi:MAG: lysine--tRNA ligase, partial [Candidatus Diapherotrites archaeon]|nr:lysine--tRNA ligase [Candidatus Diapherotrites archaeon]